MLSKESVVELNVKAVEDDGTFSGYASVFGVLDSHRDIVAKGAFLKSLATRPAEKVRMFWSHDRAQPIGRWIEMKEDERGLFVRGQFILEVAKAREAHALAKADQVKLSIGFRTVRDRLDRAKGARIIEEIDLHEVSVVSIASNDDAVITAVKTTSTLSDFSQLVAAINDTRRNLSKGTK